MEKRNEMLQNVLLDKDRIFDLKLFWFEMICSQLSDWNIKQIWLLKLPSQLAGWGPEATAGWYFWTIYFSLWGVGGCLYYYDQARARARLGLQGPTGPDLSCKQPTGSVSVSLVVRQEGRGQAGVGGVVRDAVLGVEKTLGVCRVDERWRTSVEDALGGGNLESSLQPGRHYQGGTSQSSALSDHGGLWGHGGLQGLVSDLQSRRSGGLQTSCNGEIFL